MWDVPVAHPYYLKSFGLFSEFLLCSEYWEGRVNQASFCLHSSTEVAHICFRQKNDTEQLLKKITETWTTLLSSELPRQLMWTRFAFLSREEEGWLICISEHFRRKDISVLWV